MTDKQIIIDGVDVSGCYQYMPRHMEDYDIDTLDYCRYHFKSCKDVDIKYCYFKQLKQKEQECEELHSRTASIIYSLTGGRLSYSTYTLEGCEQAYHDQLEIDVERATKELQEENETLKQELEELKEEHKGCRIGIKDMSIENTEICKISEKYKRALDEIEKYLDAQQKYFDGEDYHNLLDIINKAKEENNGR